MAKNRGQENIFQWWEGKPLDPYNEILLSNAEERATVHAATWVTLQCIVLSENPASKVPYCMVHSQNILEKTKI